MSIAASWLKGILVKALVVGPLALVLVACGGGGGGDNGGGDATKAPEATATATGPLEQTANQILQNNKTSVVSIITNTH
jgi:hypothetical protein